MKVRNLLQASPPKAQKRQGVCLFECAGLRVTSTNVLVYDVIDIIKHVDNDYAIAEAVVVRLFTLLCYRSLLHLVWWQRFGISNHHS